MTTSRRREILPGVRAWRCPKSSSPRKRPPLMWGFRGHGGGARVEAGPRRTAEGAWPRGRWYVSVRKSWCEDASASRRLRLLRLSDGRLTRNLQLQTMRQVPAAARATPPLRSLSTLGSRPPRARKFSRRAAPSPKPRDLLQSGQLFSANFPSSCNFSLQEEGRIESWLQEVGQVVPVAKLRQARSARNGAETSGR